MGVLENDQKYILCLYEIAKGSKKKCIYGPSLLILSAHIASHNWESACSRQTCLFWADPLVSNDIWTA